MAKIFTITPQIRKIAADAIDDLIDQLGKDCLLQYDALKIDCPNCIYDISTNRSTNKYQIGGPRPFPTGTLCPVCKGVGTLNSTHTDTVRMLCQWNPRKFNILPGNLEVPNSWVQTKGYMTDLPKIMQSKKMIIELPITPYIRATFNLWGDPIDAGNIIQGRYFIALWKQSK